MTPARINCRATPFLAHDHMRRRVMPHETRGFSLLETLAATLVLGVGTVALARTAMVTSRGVSWTQGHAVAHTLAEQRLTDLGTRSSASLPACTGAVGCRLSWTELEADLAPAAGFQCTQYTDGEKIEPTTEPSATGTYRVDTVVSDPPEAGRFPSERVATVSVCWRDSNGRFQQLQEQQVVLTDD